MSTAAQQPRDNRAWGSRAGRVAESAIARARLSVVPRPQARTSQAPFLFLVSLVLVGGVIGLLLFNTSMQQASFAQRSLEEQATVLSAQQESLQSRLEAMRSPQRIAERAQRLGMVQPSAWCPLTLGQAPTCTAPAAAGGANLRLREPAPIKPAALDPAPVVVRAPADGSRDTSAASPASGQSQGRNDPKNNKSLKHHKSHTRTTSR